MEVFYEELIDGRYVAWIRFDHDGSSEDLVGPQAEVRNSAMVYVRAAEVALDAGIDSVRITRKRRAA